MEKEFKKCGNYPQCTFAECECHFLHIMRQHSQKKNKQTQKKTKEISKFVVKNNEVVPIFKE